MNILLLKESKGFSDPYHLALADIGAVHSFPVLHFTFINLENLGQMLAKEDKYHGIVFTSGNSVKAIKSCIQSGLFVNVDKWRQKKCYVVGKATEKYAVELGFKCSGSSCGNAEQLAELIIKEYSGHPETQLLFPCGQLRKETLPQMLRSAGIHLQCTTVYETGEHPDIPNSIRRHRNEADNPTFVVFFSPSGVNFSLSKFKDIYKEDFHRLKIVAIGQTTAEALTGAGCPPCCVAGVPTPGGLLSSIKHFVASS